MSNIAAPSIYQEVHDLVSFRIKDCPESNFSLPFQQRHTPYLKLLIFADWMAQKSEGKSKEDWMEKFRSSRETFEDYDKAVFKHVKVLLLTQGSVVVEFQIAIDKDTIRLIENDSNDKFTPGFLRYTENVLASSVNNLQTKKEKVLWTKVDSDSITLSMGKWKGMKGRLFLKSINN